MRTDVTTKRDPRIDPKPGDVLAKNGKKRTVLFLVPCGSWADIYYQSQGRKVRCYSGTWRDWAKGAEVFHAAE